MRPLTDYLNLKQIRFETNVKRGNVIVPLAIHRAGSGEIWVDVRHPLIDGALCVTDVCQLAQVELMPYWSLDSYTLVHDLPTAVKELQI